MKISIEDYLGDYCASNDERCHIGQSQEMVGKIAEDIAKSVDKLSDEWR